jgi:TonB family protein
MWQEGDLKFAADGSPESSYTKGPFTTAGFEADSVKLKNDTLQIKGVRMGLEFDAQGDVTRKSFDKITVEIAGTPGQDYGRALDAIFTANLESLRPQMSFYWKDLAARNFKPKASFAPRPITVGTDKRLEITDCGEDSDGVEGKARPKGQPIVRCGVTAPRVTVKPVPVYTRAATRTKHSGDVLISFIVNEDGVPDAASLRLLRATGMGLDESAIYAADHTRFNPAMRDGVPIKVIVSTLIHFETD